ncbi:thioredoxin family protein [Desulfobotulus mexicanus]|uniref:Thioredoxin family protein n=1 Tax=Desulfobotulus mexicanus TaxID=2586642 RepID=A0A5Q4VE50_9BACT|nr:thioredoxin fold domain-containing protein [Desulfobotulus mexicanus]TYT75979.1 thioredoxin family protein [Desulfobotulus mexicanus]
MQIFRMMIVSILLFWTASATLAGEGIVWLSKDQAVERAAAEGKKIYYYFYTPSCPSCQIMGKNTLEDPEVVSLLNSGFVSTKVHASLNRAQAESLGVTLVPTSIFFSAEGEEISRKSGYLPPDEFIEVLKNLDAEK